MTKFGLDGQGSSHEDREQSISEKSHNSVDENNHRERDYLEPSTSKKGTDKRKNSEDDNQDEASISNTSSMSTIDSEFRDTLALNLSVGSTKVKLKKPETKKAIKTGRVEKKVPRVTKSQITRNAPRRKVRQRRRQRRSSSTVLSSLSSRESLGRTCNHCGHRCYFWKKY